jgi:DNA-binding MarR family transcriptional regulator
MDQETAQSGLREGRTAQTAERQAGRIQRHEALSPALAERLGFLLGQAKAILHQAAEPALPAGFTGKHVGCLSVIATEGPLSQQRLGERAAMDRTTVVAIVDALEEAGYVVRRRDPSDRRAYALEITDPGREWLEDARAIIVGVEDDFLAPLTAAERRTLVELLQRLLTGSTQRSSDLEPAVAVERALEAHQERAALHQQDVLRKP